MSAFDFVNHEFYPEDEYTSESVVLCFDKKHRVTYVRKKTQNGGMFWDVISASVKYNGVKKYLKGYSQDSNFLNEDIKNFLDNRSWEKAAQCTSPFGGGPVAQNKNDDEIPF